MLMTHNADLRLCCFSLQQKFVRCSVRAEVRHLRKVLCHRLNVEKHQVGIILMLHQKTVFSSVIHKTLFLPVIVTLNMSTSLWISRFVLKSLCSCVPPPHRSRCCSITSLCQITWPWNAYGSHTGLARYSERTVSHCTWMPHVSLLEQFVCWSSGGGLRCVTVTKKLPAVT